MTMHGARAFILTLLLPEMTSRVAQRDVKRLATTYTLRALIPMGLAGRIEQFTSPRAWAFVLLAMQEYLRSFSGDRMVNQLRDLLTTRRLELFQANSSKDWLWFEPLATYDNTKLSHAMILRGHWTSRGEVFQQVCSRCAGWRKRKKREPGISRPLVPTVFGSAAANARASINSRLYSTGILLRPDTKRVVVRPFIPTNPTRIEHIITRALALSEECIHWLAESNYEIHFDPSSEMSERIILSRLA